MSSREMGAIRTKFFTVLVILLYALVTSGSEYENRVDQVILDQLVDPATGKFDENMAELLWVHCGSDIIHLKKAVEDLKLWFPQRSTSDINRGKQPGAKGNIEKLINELNPQLKQIFVDCIRKNKLPLPVTGEEGASEAWYMEYLKLLFSWHDAPRRKLATEGPQSSLGPSASAPSPGPASAPGPARAAGSRSQSPAPLPPGRRRRGSSPPAPTPQNSFFPPIGLEPPPPGPSGSSNSGPDVQPKERNDHKPVIIAVAVTAAVTFIVAALFFLCCSKICKKGGGRRNDERPLLSLSLSEYSIGSSLVLGDSIKEEKLGHQPFGNNTGHNKTPLSFYLESDVQPNSLNEKLSLEAVGTTTKTTTESINSSSNINGQGIPPLKPPPGRMSNALPGQPPLNPPPRRAQPLPPKPPASLKPPPSMAAPPPPPPPAPRPPLKSSAASAGPPPPPAPPGPRPPPLPKSGLAPPRPPPPIAPGAKAPRPPFMPKPPSSEGAALENETDATKAKLKPFFWDKVLANPDHSMVWHQIKSGSFQFNEEMIETLFGYAPSDKTKVGQKKDSSSQDPSPQFIQILDPKKAQNLSILLRALNVTTEEVCDALHEANELPVELIQTLLKMAPTSDEELKLRLFSGELSQLGPAERFLKALVDIPFAFMRLEALLFMCTLQEEVATTRESFETLEIACKELRNSRLFLKLLEAVLKTGNRMNDGTFRGGAQAFKLDTLLKLSDVKGIDGKTTLLHFVVQEIIRSEGLRAARAARDNRSFSSVKTDDLLLEEVNEGSEEHYRSLGLQVVSRLSSELENVKKAAILDSDSLTGTVAKLGHALLKTRNFLNTDMKNLQEESGFHKTLKSFVQDAEVDVMSLLEEEKRIMALVKSTGDYFHGNSGKDEGLRLFVIVRDFLITLDKACKDVRDAPRKTARAQKKEASTASASADHHRQTPSIDLHQRLFPAIQERRTDDSSSDSDD